MKLVAYYSSCEVNFQFRIIIIILLLTISTTGYNVKNSLLFSLRSGESHIALLYTHHVHVHLRSRLDSRYKSSGNVEGRQREEQRSDGERPCGLSADIGQMSRYMCKCMNEMLERRDPDSRIKNDAERIRVHTTMNSHGCICMGAYKCPFGTLTQKQNRVHRTQTDSLSAYRCERDLDMKISKYKMQRDYLQTSHYIGSCTLKNAVYI